MLLYFKDTAELERALRLATGPAGNNPRSIAQSPRIPLRRLQLLQRLDALQNRRAQALQRLLWRGRNRLGACMLSSQPETRCHRAQQHIEMLNRNIGAHTRLRRIGG